MPWWLRCRQPECLLTDAVFAEHLAPCTLASFTRMLLSQKHISCRSVSDSTPKLSRQLCLVALRRHLDGRQCYIASKTPRVFSYCLHASVFAIPTLPSASRNKAILSALPRNQLQPAILCSVPSTPSAHTFHYACFSSDGFRVSLWRRARDSSVGMRDFPTGYLTVRF